MLRRPFPTNIILLTVATLFSGSVFAGDKADEAVSSALRFLVAEQKRQGYWEAERGSYRVAMTALAGTAMLAEGSTTTTGEFSDPIRKLLTTFLR